jgi:hypothetical protein
MARCQYCGESAGILRNFHSACRKRHDGAIRQIPTFFPKLLGSTLPAARFVELLREVGKVSLISTTELADVFISGIHSTIDEVLKERLVTEAEEDRLRSLIAAFGLDIAEAPGEEDRFYKLGILRDLSDGKLPVRVEVSGEIPFDLGESETILWIFNKVISRRIGAEDASGARLELTKPGAPTYYPPQLINARMAGKGAIPDRPAGDLTVTNLNLFFICNGRVRKTPLADITCLDAFTDGIRVTTHVHGRPTNFFLDDSWFALLLMAGAERLTRSRFHSPQIEQSSTGRSMDSVYSGAVLNSEPSDD